MESYSVFGIQQLNELIDYTLFNRDNPQRIISEIGVVLKDNGYNTLFLKPHNALFNTAWVSLYERDIITSVSLGGELSLKVEDIYKEYPKFRCVYNRYDDCYDYYFSPVPYNGFEVKICSDTEIIKSNTLLQNYPLEVLTINLNSLSMNR